MLTAAQMKAREGRLTASRVACLMTADEPQILRLWQEMTKDPHFVPDDLTQVWPVRLGETTEQLQLDWFELKHGSVSRRGDVALCDRAPWAAATLDGWSDERGCPIECKHVGGREPIEVIIERYQPQMQWQMIVTGADECALSVIFGADEPTVEIIPADQDYADELFSRAEQFMQCVWTKTPPVTLPPVAAPVKPIKTYDMTGNNAWANASGLWREHRVAKSVCMDAEKELKSLVPEDAIVAHGYGVIIKRDKANRLSLREHTA